MKALSFALILLVTCIKSFGQTQNIDLYCHKLDSSLISEDIILHSVRRKTDFGEAQFYDQYYIDTSKNILVKSIYEFYFDGSEFLEFYYFDNKIVKIKAKHDFNDRKFKGEFYFKSDTLVAHTDGEFEPGKIAFHIEQLLKTGNEYVKNSIEIIKSLKAVKL